MHRLFVAIRPPEPIRGQLLDLMEGLPNARWQDEEQLHLTLRFIGQVDRHRAEDVAVALGNLRHPRLEICLAGVGCFERRGKGALWAGVAPREPLNALHRKLDQLCLQAGLAPDTRAYHPHITLARFSRTIGPIEPFVRRWSGLSSPAFEIASVQLFESRLGSNGASYAAVARYPLG